MAPTESNSTPRRSAFTVRARIVGVVVVVAAVGIFFTGAFVHVVQRERILSGIDERLTTSVENVRFVVTEHQWTAIGHAVLPSNDRVRLGPDVIPRLENLRRERVRAGRRG